MVVKEEEEGRLIVDCLVKYARHIPEKFSRVFREYVEKIKAYGVMTPEIERKLKEIVERLEKWKSDVLRECEYKGMKGGTPPTQ